jgi:proteasome lid subunit RPN8/RPN11
MQEQIELLDKIGDEIKQVFSSASVVYRPKELCGLISVLNDKYSLTICENVAKNPVKNFEIAPKDYLKAALKGEVVSVIHSHTSKRDNFSILDKTICELHKINSILYHVDTKAFYEYVPCGYVNDYLGRKFEWGKTDCLSLVIDYYKKELNITIGKFFKQRRKDFFARERESFSAKEYLQIINNEGFIALNKNEPVEINDIFFMKENESSPFPSHLAIYIDNNIILHQLRNSDSVLEKVNENIMNRIECIIRHRTLI